MSRLSHGSSIILYVDRSQINRSQITEDQNQLYNNIKMAKVKDLAKPCLLMINATFQIHLVIPVVSLGAPVAPLSLEALEAAAGARLDIALLVHRARRVTSAGLQFQEV